MNQAIKEALESLHSGGLPFGAALYDSEYNLIHSAHNKTQQLNDNSLHAEVVLFMELEGQDINYSQCLLMTTCEPCEHCFKVAYNLGVREFEYGSTIETSSKYFSSDNIVKIEDLAEDIVVDCSSQDECDSLFEIYSDKKVFLPNVLESKGNLIERYWMEVALKVARRGMIEAGEIPVGVILVRENGLNDEELRVESYTQTYSTNTLVIHGDINAIILAERETIESGATYSMYSTLEPHLLGFGAAMKARLRKVVFGLEAWADGGSHFFKTETDSLEVPPYIVSGVYRDKQYELFKEFMELERDNQSRVGYPYVKSLVDYYEEVYGGGDEVE